MTTLTTLTTPATAHPHAASDPPERKAPPRVPPPEDFFLPKGYSQQTDAFTRDDARPIEGDDAYWNPERIAASRKWQRHVYAWAAHLVQRHGLASVLDVGCGPGTKLAELVAPVCPDIEGIDQPSAIAAARRLNIPGTFRPVDLERPESITPWRTFDLIIFSDVIEHLLDPGPSLDLIRRFCHPGSLVLVSTPDRARLRGRSCMASEKPEHVREWSAPELRRYLQSQRLNVRALRALPADDAPASRGLPRELAWRLRLAPTSPHRCLAALCRPRVTA